MIAPSLSVASLDHVRRRLIDDVLAELNGHSETASPWIGRRLVGCRMVTTITASGVVRTIESIYAAGEP